MLPLSPPLLGGEIAGRDVEGAASPCLGLDHLGRVPKRGLGSRSSTPSPSLMVSPLPSMVPSLEQALIGLKQICLLH